MYYPPTDTKLIKMSLGTCRGCGDKYELSGKYAWRCGPCRRKYARDKYSARSEDEHASYMAVQTARKRELSQFVYDYLATHPCKCGEARVACLQFDHLKDKKFNVADMPGKGLSKLRIEEEIAKCEVLCANCHAVKTAKQLNWYANIVA